MLKAMHFMCGKGSQNEYFRKITAEVLKGAFEWYKNGGSRQDLRMD